MPFRHPSPAPSRVPFPLPRVPSRARAPQRTLARKHYTARGQSNQLPTDEETPRIYVKASRGLGEKLFRRTERNF